MTEIKLSTPSYIVLGLVETLGEASPYDLKKLIGGSLASFWTVQHSQLYSEPQRLAEAGLLQERREQGGRKRHLYSPTQAGRRALEAWRCEPLVEIAEMRQPSLLKLFFGADPQALAAVELDLLTAELTQLEQTREQARAAAGQGQLLALEGGLRRTRFLIGFWRDVADGTALES